MVNDYGSLLMHSGFCGNRVSDVLQMVADATGTPVKAQSLVMAETSPPERFPRA